MEQPSPPDSHQATEEELPDRPVEAESLEYGRIESAASATPAECESRALPASDDSPGGGDISDSLDGRASDSTPQSDAAKDRPASKAHRILLWLVIAGALALRLWGIGWGLPDQRRLFSYHPDEGVNLVQGVLRDGAFRPHLDLGFYNYGSAYFYAWQAAEAVNRSYGMVALPPTGAPNEPSAESIGAMILVGRLISALLGALTALPIFAVGRRLYGPAAGLAAAALYTVMPAAVVHAHFATVDVAAAFAVMVALAAGARLFSKRPSIRDAAMAGALCGVAAATKYNAGLVVAAPAAALLLSRREPGAPGRFAALFGSAAAAFLLACPGVFLNWPRFSTDFLFEVTKSGQGMGLLFEQTAPGWVFHLTSSLRYGLGLPLLALALAGVGFALVRRGRPDLYLLSFAMVYYLVIGAAQVKFLRYVIPLMPVLALLAGRALAAAWQIRRPLTRTLTAAGAAAGGAGLFTSLALCSLMAGEDARSRALEYIHASVPQGAVIGFARTPWFDTPPLSPLFTALSPGQRRAAAESLRDYTVRLPARDTELDPSVLFPPLPGLVILSDIETEDWQRLRLPAWRQWEATLAREYRPVVFENIPAFAGISLGKPAYVPHDLLYIYPRITLYERK